MYLSRWWFVWKVSGALQQLDMTRDAFDKRFYSAVMDVGMLEGLNPEETAILLFHQIPASKWSDRALSRVARWKQYLRLRDDAERKAIQFRSGVPFEEVFPTAARYAPKVLQPGASSPTRAYSRNGSAPARQAGYRDRSPRAGMIRE
jgi:hypothetical protein